MGLVTFPEELHIPISFLEVYQFKFRRRKKKKDEFFLVFQQDSA